MSAAVAPVSQQTAKYQLTLELGCVSVCVCLMQSHLELAGPAVVPDMMYGTLDIFNPHNAKLLAATAAGMPCLLLNPVFLSFHLGPHHPCHQFLWRVHLAADQF